MKAIIVEDNLNAANVIQSFIRDYPQDIEVTAVADTVDKATRLIREHRPNLLFLDIQLHHETVFDMFKKLDEEYILETGIIFITAYQTAEYLKQALRHSAIDYIVKPIDQEKLFEAIDTAINRIEKLDILGRIARLEEAMRDVQMQLVKSRIPVNRVNGNIDLVDSNAILFIDSEDKISRIHLKDDVISTTRPLKHYEDLLEDHSAFIRISKQAILNIRFLKSFDSKTKIAFLRNGMKLLVSRRRVKYLLDAINA
jgi:two-component system LytT family response regulator